MSSLDGMGLSPLQERAVLDERSPLLVAAGAGSGKTSLLVAYFVRALVDEGVLPEALVAVTFTRKAAAELSGRISEQLEHLGRPDLARSLGAATIGTIHSLCRRLIREHALEAGVDPACSVVEAEAAWLIKDQIGREAWEWMVEEADEAELAVLAARGESLRKQIVPLYDRLRGLGWEQPQIDIASGGPAGDPRAELRRSLDRALKAGTAVDRPSATLQTDLERLHRCRLWLDGEVGPVRGADDLALTQDFFPSRRTKAVEPYFTPVRDCLTDCRCLLAVEQLRPLVGVMNRLLRRFHESYQAHKEERGLVDFADLELRARRLVLGSGGPALVAPGSRVLIDEFQDTNELQCSILEHLGGERVLMVGDECQSIYRFRGADVGVFQRRRSRLEGGSTAGGAEIPAGVGAGGGAADGALHVLDVNYRSRPRVLAFINHLFGHPAFFGSRFVPLRSPGPEERRDSAESGPSRTRERGEGVATPAPTSSVAVEVLVVSRPEEAEEDGSTGAIQRAEARAMTAAIHRLIHEEGFAQRDVVVLLPAQTYVNVYQQELARGGIDVYIVRGQGYYSQEEVADVISLLRLFVNPHDDLALVAVLRSPLAGISDDALYLLALGGSERRASLWEAVVKGDHSALPVDDRQRLATFVRRFKEMRARVGRPGLARLIDDAVSVCGYDVCVLSSDRGAARFANIRKLMRLAAEYESLEGPDLAGFVDLLESMGDISDREGSAPTLAEGEDVVRVMTVHQAKGLEFPAVVLGGLGSTVPHDSGGEFVIADDGRMAVFLKGSQRATYETRDLCWGPGAAILAEQRAREDEEDVRLLYVAMTRAKDKLLLIGARSGGDDLRRCRVGRIVGAFGLENLPEEGEVTLEPLSARVLAVRGENGGGERAPESQAAMGGSDQQCVTAEPPSFLDGVAGSDAPRRMSFSALAAHERCPRRYYLERVLGLELEDPPDEGDPGEERPTVEKREVLDDEERDAGRDVGLLVHALLERLPGATRPAEAAVFALAREWLAGTAVPLSDAGVERAVGLALAFWDSPASTVAGSAGATREEPFLFRHDGVVVSGVMDLLDRGRTLWRIVDYKTNRLAGRSPGQVAADYGLQAAVYCLAALRAGAPAVQMDFVFLEQPSVPVAVGHDPGAVPILEAVVEQALAGFRHSRFEARRSAHCAGCPVAEVCGVMAQA